MSIGAVRVHGPDIPGPSKGDLALGEVVWAEGSVGSSALAKNNSAIDTPSKMIGCLVLILRTTSCMTFLLSGKNTLPLSLSAHRKRIVPVRVHKHPLCDNIRAL